MMGGQRLPKGLFKKRKNGRVPEIVRESCLKFILDNKIPFGMHRILLPLALKSYKNLPISQRDTWTLEEVVKQML